MEPIASCYAVLLHEPQLRGTIAARRESRSDRPVLQVPRVMSGARGVVARLRGVFARTYSARTAWSAAGCRFRQRPHRNDATTHKSFVEDCRG